MEERLERGAALKLGGALALAGAITFLIGLLWHGDLPDRTTALALQHIAERALGVLTWRRAARETDALQGGRAR